MTIIISDTPPAPTLRADCLWKERRAHQHYNIVYALMHQASHEPNTH